MTDMIGDKVVVTTEHRGVFHGTLVSKGDTVVLLKARCCVYWSSTVRGFLGLASHGPDSESRITRSVPRLELEAVTSVVLCTPEANAAWEAEPWS